MGYVPLPRFLFRAPLLPARALADARRSLRAHPLGNIALALASPALAAAMSRAPRARATGASLERYARRAAFRPTPHGLWAGVGVGHLGRPTRLSTGAPAARLAPSWPRMAALGRALLERGAVRDQARLRRAPSLTLGARTMTWLGPAGEDFCEEKTAELDEALEEVVRRCREWTPWPTVRRAAAELWGADPGADGDNAQDEAGEAALGDVDEWLLTLVDDGALVVDTVPPLIGPPAASWMAERLAALPAASDVARALEEAQAALAAGQVGPAEAMLGRLPATPASGAAVQGTLVFIGPKTDVVLSRKAVARAAALAPLLFRLQEALAPPSAERTPGRALAETLDAATELFGAGALDLPALARGEYGASPAGDPGESDAPPLDGAGAAAVVALLTDRIVAAARAGAAEITLRADELEPLLPLAAPPATCELFLTPCRPGPAAATGDGWLLGLHAPAGASWGRFAGALAGEAAADLPFEALREGERRARPDERHLDVAFAPSSRVAELCAHPPLRDAALALTDWPAGDHPALTLEDLQLVADPAALEPLALRSAAGEVVTPAPLHRVRSTTAPPGVWRLLAGWSLRRQHAPWALTWGPLGGLAWTPRVRLDGFVIAPASWRLPPSLTPRRLGAWRRAHRVPRHVQVGHEDELLPVDLDAPRAVELLAGHERVHEIWPPLGDTADRDGRRVEAVVALVDEPDARAAAAATATRAAGLVPPPGRQVATADASPWVTFKLFGAADRQDAVLAEVVAPLVEKARRARWLRAWFFQRYVEGPGRRPHLRLRVAGQADVVAGAMERLLPLARQAGDIVSVERAPYFPEVTRFGGEAALPAVHALFQAASELALAALSGGEADQGGLADEVDPRLLLLIGTHDALARAAGLEATERRALARQRRDAHAADVDEEFAAALARDFRRARPALRDILGAEPGPLDGLLAPYRQSTQAALTELSPERRRALLPALLHLDAVRLLGPERDAEIRAYTFWERTLESLERHAASPRRAG